MGKNIRFRFCKTEKVRFLSHLDLLRTMERALRRAQLPIAFSGGFSPKPIISFASALPVGILSKAEYADFTFSQAVDPLEFQTRYNEHLPSGLKVLQARLRPADAPALMQIVDTADYRLFLPGKTLSEMEKRLDWLLALDTFLVERQTKRGKRKVNVRPLLLETPEIKDGCRGLILCCRCAVGQKGNLRMEELGMMLGFDHFSSKITRTALLVRDGGKYSPPLKN
ncbi:MAG: DUF2344 domain-containing protein [Firmicutes bacterium]|nr:DUF2344 domain-containing protein [Bacillota bacterium]